jgi:hypothetical protein
MSLSVRTTHDYSCEMRLHVSLEQKHIGGELSLTSVGSHLLRVTNAPFDQARVIYKLLMRRMRFVVSLTKVLYTSSV